MYRELLEKLKAGEMRLHEIDGMLDTKDAVKLRRAAISELTGVEFKHIDQFSFDAEDITKRNIENMIGAIQVPLGVAGPLLINGEYASGRYYIPLATTEGALVASTHRGCSVITACGGANVRIFKDEMTRAPVFRANDVIGVKRLVEWVKENFQRLKEKAEETTRFGRLLAVDPFVAGRSVFLRFSYDTGDAMGMNMVTIATNAAVDLIIEENDVELVALSGNMCTDKKPAAINAIMGKGKTVSADVVLSREIVLGKLKTTPERMVEVNYRKNLVGSARAGSLGFNAHAANIAAAMFIACGQDAAHVVEASNAMTTIELKDEDLYCSVTLPSLAVGTVGGGTRIGAQQECLSMLGAAGAGDPPGVNSKKLAEIIAAAVLAGEISLIGALAARHLAKAHAALGR
ncbi:NADP-dependent hydroxymethylglutaryl-CoA reductase [Candidatus Methanoperedens nitroreducens]|uniref:3-hydroxy-3-methylglutaryl coenzyme A reductase n=1 Tax=Candidatus Methanoperedens nitratireducens TaxID=1392998 RepID=A0A062UXM6_9EURY|nr:hydroxymethylglutaryl-CoA reductase (NADPH) [Candidatus Methanoperedens nitroreducens]KCZ71736.1 NADP-dependent hydroxymethylglutaryl-CoA reductase [Candidatus Methanoperedens nitroreducens]MDJ1422291.1 hydroxymethylglutaryl-CoA reductase (NADPH) [Candidatus Methanoperedens sp.]